MFKRSIREETSNMNDNNTGNTTTTTSPLWCRAMESILEKPEPPTIQAKRLTRSEQVEAKRLARQESIKDRALRKTVGYYRPVMSRIINDVGFNAPARIMRTCGIEATSGNSTNRTMCISGYKEFWSKVFMFAMIMGLGFNPSLRLPL